MTRAIVLGGSRGIGRAIADSLRSIDCDVIATSKKELDTSDLESVRNFIKNQDETDILILNTGGPPAKDFFSISEEEWQQYHRQLFLGFCLLLQGVRIKEGGYIFLISSGVIRESNSKLVMSTAYRLAFAAVFKVLSKDFAARNISCINIAPGPINTDRARELISDMEAFQKTLPMKRLGDPKEIGNFVKAMVENKIKYLSGATITFDGAISNCIL